jgi:hypothetical protein
LTWIDWLRARYFADKINVIQFVLQVDEKFDLGVLWSPKPPDPPPPAPKPVWEHNGVSRPELAGYELDDGLGGTVFVRSFGILQDGTLVEKTEPPPTRPEYDPWVNPDESPFEQPRDPTKPQ